MKTTKGSIQRLALVALSAGIAATYVAPARAQVCEPVKIGSAMKFYANPGVPDNTVLVQFGTSMRYLRNSADPGLGTTWSAEGFVDSGWTSGTYGVGYENAPTINPLIQTAVTPAANSIYTRATFTIADITKVSGLFFGADYDDGYVVWINGVEAARVGVPPATAWNSAATSHESSNAVPPTYGPLVDVFTPAVQAALHNGTNVVAVGVWNTSLPSTDLVIVPKLQITNDAVPVQFGSAMKYLRNAINPGAVVDGGWMAEAFVDSGWTSGTYGVGYEQVLPGATNLIRTPVTAGALSIYTRATFSVADVTTVSGLFFGADYDDGYVVWINGIEVARVGVAASQVWNTDATSHESSNGSEPNYGTLANIVALGIPALHNGNNVLAVGVWNNGGAASADLVISPKLVIVRSSNWTAPGFDDSTWSPGTYGVGYDTATAAPYADSPVPGNDLIQTSVTPEPGTFSVYTRAIFNVANPASVTALNIGADYDDGWAAFINGVEVYRSPELPAGSLQHTTNATITHESSNSRGHCSIATSKSCDTVGTGLFNCSVAQGVCVLTSPPLPDYGAPINVTTAAVPALVAGVNVFAVGVWNNAAATSTDLVLVPDLKVTLAPGSDVCNGIDDDCDGSTDEDFVPSVTTCGVGACAATGGTTCVAGSLVNSCTPGPSAAEICGNAIDDDCDGATDEGCGSGSFSLVAKPFVKTIAGNPVPMWGFALDTGGDCVTGPEVPTVPGPRLSLSVGISDLSITVRNCVSESISLAIPGLTRALDPTFVDSAPVPSVTATGSRPGGDVTSRIRSFDTEILPGGTHTYNWTGVKPGTYLYQSGTHAAVQVQMGLYGMLTHDYAAGQAYQGVAYNREALLVYSEVDPTRPIVPSALGFAPQYFLVNGESFSPASLPVAANAHERVLLRFVNAGLQNHVPTFLGAYMKAVAEDAHPYPYARDQYGVLLPAGKTLDAVWTVDACGGTTPLFDRRLWLSEPGTGAAGGMLVKFVAAPSGVIPSALNDPSYAVVQGNTLVVAAPGVLGNDTSAVPMTAVLVAGPTNGTLTLDPSGSFRYTPNVGFSGPDTFTYTANDCASSNIATVTVTVSANSNPAPIAAGNSYSVAEDGVLHTAVPGVLTGDTDPAPAGPAALTAVLGTGVSNGTLILNPNGSFDYTPLANYNGGDSFTYRAYDGQFYSNVATVNLTVTPVNDAPVANDDTVQTKRQTPVVIALLANDTDADGNAQINAATRTIVIAPSNGTLVLGAGGAVTYTARPGFLGTDTFTYTVRDDAPANALSNQAVVRVNVTK